MPEKRFKAFTYDELIKRSSAISLSLDIFWLKDDGLEDSHHCLTPTCWRVSSTNSPSSRRTCG